MAAAVDIYVGGAEVEQTARFWSIEEMLAYAFTTEARMLYPKPGFEMISRGTSPAEVTDLERIADGAMIRSFCLRYAGLRGGVMIRARYRIPSPFDPLLAARFNDDCIRAQYFVREHFRQIHRKRKLEKGKIPGRWKIPPRWMVVDYVRDWSLGGRAHHPPEKWAEKVEVARSTAYLWRSQCHNLLTSWLNLAQWRIEPEAVAAGLLEPQ